MRFLLIAGPAGAGKDTLARAIAARWPGPIDHLARPLYDTLSQPVWHQALAHAAQHGVTPAQARRQALQALGDAFRAIHPAALVEALVDRLDPTAPTVIVPDVRLPEEVAAFRALGETCVIYCDIAPDLQTARLMRRDGAPLSAAAAHHLTEQAGSAVKAQADLIHHIVEDPDDTTAVLDALTAVFRSSKT